MSSKLANDATRKRFMNSPNLTDSHMPAPHQPLNQVEQYHHQPTVNPSSAEFAANFRYDPYTQSICNINSSSFLKRSRSIGSNVVALSEPNRKGKVSKSCASTKTDYVQDPVVIISDNRNRRNEGQHATVHPRRSLQSECHPLQSKSDRKWHQLQSGRNEFGREQDREHSRPVSHEAAPRIANKFHLAVTSAKRRRQREYDAISSVPQFDKGKWLDAVVQDSKFGSYSTDGIASDILRALGTHPTRLPLNAHHFRTRLDLREGHPLDKQARRSTAYKQWAGAEKRRVSRGKEKEKAAKLDSRNNVALIHRQCEERWQMRDGNDGGDDDDDEGLAT